MKMFNAGDIIEFDYVNWKGDKGHRNVFIKCFNYGSTEFHQEAQWLMDAFDYDKHDVRVFAMKDMSNVKMVKSI